MVAGNADDLDAPVREGLHAAFQCAVCLEKVLVPVDHIPGEQHRRYARLERGVHCRRHASAGPSSVQKTEGNRDGVRPRWMSPTARTFTAAPRPVPAAPVARC